MNVLSFILQATVPHRRFLIIPFINATVFALIKVGVPTTVKYLVNASQSGDTTILWWYGSALILQELIVAGMWRVNDWALLKYEPALRNTITQTAFAQLSAQPHRFFQNNFAGALTAKITDMVNAIPTMITTSINGFFHNALVLSITTAMLASISPLFALALIAWAISFLAVSAITLSRFSYLIHQAAEAGSQVAARCVDALTNMLGVRLFSTHKEEAGIIGKAQRGYLNASQKRRWFSLKLNVAQSITFWLYQATCVYLLIKLRSAGQVSPGDFALILGLNLSLVHDLWELSEKMRDFADHWGQTSQALTTFYTPLEVQDAPDARELVCTEGTIVFNHARFSYPRGEALFQDTVLTIPAGQKVGLVGYSGGGKSTFVNLILRLYDLASGAILIDGQNIAKVTQSSLRKAIAFVPQEPSLFHRTVGENIAYGNPDATEAQIKDAARKAAAHEFIMKMPDRYDTVVGERGTKLSGGQRQRVALARALLKQAPILILDEATSQLDTITEQEIQTSFTKWFEDHGEAHKQTTLVIAHRLSTLLHMDRILVFDKGHIVQDGTHQELLAQEGLYATLWHVQHGKK